MAVKKSALTTNKRMTPECFLRQTSTKGSDKLLYILISNLYINSLVHKINAIFDNQFVTRAFNKI